MTVSGPRVRALLARLALDAGRPVAAETLVDDLWGRHPPADVGGALQSLVSRLRKALGPAAALELSGGGYVLRIEPDDVDVHRFERLAAQGGRELTARRYADAAALLTRALAEFSGPPLADVTSAPFAAEIVTRLSERRLVVLEDRAAAQLQLGQHAEVVAELEEVGERYPLRERLAALRLRALAALGRRSEAFDLYERVRATLADELGVDPSAELREAHLALLRDERPEPPPARAGTVQLPARLTSFVGRHTELTELAAMLAEHRLVTLTGAGGAGKTRLAVEMAERHPAHSQGRVWFVPLADVVASTDVRAAVLRAVESGVATNMPGFGNGGFDRLVDTFAAGESLLVLDNCEHVIDAVAELAHALLTRVPSLRILATSREPLAVTGEALCPVGPLDLPADELVPDAVTGATGEVARDMDLAEVGRSSAVRLFVDRGRAVCPGFTLDEDTVGPVVEICRRLDGMPLALELAAAKLRSMGVSQIAALLDDRFRLLTSGSRVALPRQRTLRAVVEWSWDLLDERERVLARRLAVFSGGVGVSAATAVCADETVPERDVAFLLGALAEKSIVDHVGERCGEPRYRMLETIRAYASERLVESGEAEDVRSRFIAHFLSVAQHHDPLLRTEGQLEAFAVFRTEYDNLIAALRLSLDIRDADSAYRLLLSLTWCWALLGVLNQREDFFSEVLALGEAIPSRARSALKVYQVSTATGRNPPGPEELRTLIDDCFRTGAMEEYPPLAVTLPALALLAGDEELLERELRRALSHPDPWARAGVRWVEALILEDKGELAEAQRVRELALRGFEDTGDRWGKAITLSMQAQSHALLGEYAAAIERLDAGVALAEELGSRTYVVQLRLLAANQEIRAGNFAAAERRLDEARRQCAGEAGQLLDVFVQLNAAYLAERRGQVEQAHRCIDRVAGQLDSLGFLGELFDGLIEINRASLLLAEGKAAKAREALVAAMRTMTSRPDRPDLATPAELLARLYHLEGDALRAAAALGLSEAIRGAFDRGNPALRELVGLLTEELGEQAYTAAYSETARLSKPDAVRRLVEQTSAQRLR